MVYPGEMGGDEIMVATLCVVVAFGVQMLLLARWSAAVGTLRPPPSAYVLVSLLAPWIVVAGVHVGLGAWGDVYVQGDVRYRFQYDAMAAAWVLVSGRVLAWLGLDALGELFARGNRAAAVTGTGAAAGLGLCFLGGNVGDGPGWAVVVFAAGLGTAVWWAAWVALARLAHAADRVVIDRHLPTGWRVGGALVALGAVCGRAVAGDWTSVGATISDAVVHLPVVAVIVAAEVGWSRWGPAPFSPREPGVVLGGVVPGVFYVALAILWVQALPHPNPVIGGGA